MEELLFMQLPTMVTWKYVNLDKNPATSTGATPLHVAAKNGHFKIYKLIVENIENVVDKNPPTKKGLTPRCIAARNGHKEIFKFLLSSEYESESTLLISK